MAASTYKPQGTIISSIDDSGKNKLKSIAFPAFKEFKTTGKVDAASLIELAKNNNLNLLLLVSYIFDLINKLADVTTNKIKSELSALADAIVTDLSSNKLFDVEAFKVELSSLLKSFSDEAIEKVVQKIDELKAQFNEQETEKEKSTEKPNKQNTSDDISEQLNALQTYVSGQFFALQKNILLAIEKSLKIQSLVKPNKQKKKEQATLNKTLDKLNKFMDNFFDNLITYVKPFVDKMLSYAKMIVNKLMMHIMVWLLANVVLIGLIFAIIIKLIAKPLMEILLPILDFISDLITKILDFLTPIRDNILIPLGEFILTMLKSIFENVLEPLLKGIGTVAYDLGVALGKLIIGVADFFVDTLLPFLRDKLLPVLGVVLDIIKELLLAIKPWIKPLVDVVLKILVDILDTVGKMFEILKPVIIKFTEFIAHVLMDILNEIKFAWDKIVKPIILGINKFLMIIVNIGRYIWAKLRSVLPKWMGGDGGKSLKELENEFAGAVEEATDKSLKGVNATMDPELMSIQTEIAILIRLISNGELFVKLANIIVDTIQKSPLISGFIKSVTEGIKKFVEALDKFVDKIDPIIKAIAESIPTIVDAIVDAIDNVVDMLKPIMDNIAVAVEKISNSITLFIDELRVLISTIGTTITNSIELITTTITGTINDIRDAIIKSIDTLTEMVRPIANNLANAITEIKDSIVKSIDRITTGILELPGKIFDKIMAGIKAILNVGKMVKDAAVNAGKAVLGGAKNLWNKMTGKKEEVKLTPDQMFEKILAKIEEIKSTDLVNLITTTLQNIITTALAASFATVTATLSTISTTITTALAASFATVTATLSTILTTINTVTETATALATLVSATILTMLTTVLLNVQGIITSLIDLPMNLAKGVTSLVSGIAGTINDLSKGVYDTVSNTVEGTAKTIAGWFSFGSDKVEVNPPKIDKVVLNTADIGSINGEVLLDKQDDKKTTIDDVNHNIVGLYDFLKPFADATRQNFELILLKLDEKPNLLPIPFANTDTGNTALMENMR